MPDQQEPVCQEPDETQPSGICGLPLARYPSLGWLHVGPNSSFANLRHFGKPPRPPHSPQEGSSEAVCRVCGETERYTGTTILRHQHVRPFGEDSNDHTFDPIQPEPPIGDPESERNDSDRATSATLTSDPVQEAVQRVKRVMYPSSQDVGQAVAALDNLVRAVQQEERDRVAALLNVIDSPPGAYALGQRGWIEHVKRAAAALRKVKP